jgi:hypothetical protein
MVAAVEHFRREAAEADSFFRIRIERADPMTATVAHIPDVEGVRGERLIGRVEERLFWTAERTISSVRLLEHERGESGPVRGTGRACDGGAG